ncbi:hypothetical protein Taro_018561 [Colocasia esculenta]|uniref:Strictosidine synthase conserved region domain-containing protein n=1 Tax=Colocasia esculenta TaxID=4460 RepID=A0A843UU74_COLES|nr:hypothetical protein [Colocasia esculenta]
MAILRNTRVMEAISLSLLISLLLPSTSSQQPAPVIDVSHRRIQLLGSVTGPEGLAFDAAGGGPYTGVSDGRVLKWEGPLHGWTEFSISSPIRNRRVCDDSTNPALEDRCGRPLGLMFNRVTGDLYIADAYFGLLMVGPAGGPATQLAIAAEGTPFRMTNAIDIDQQSGVVYFTDSSTRFQRRDWYQCIAARDATGRLMRYDPRTKQLTVFLRGLQFANGVALSRNGSFVLVGETTRGRILRYWLEGPTAGTSEVFATVPGRPDNLKRNREGQFWVGLGLGPRDVVAVKLDEQGRTVEVLRDGRGKNPVSEVEEQNGTLWLGSLGSSFVGVSTPLAGFGP